MPASSDWDNVHSYEFLNGDELAMEEEYIGDGLYAGFDGEGIRLRAPRAGGDHWVYLDPCVWDNLMKFVERLNDKGENRNDDGNHTDSGQG